MRTTKHTLEDFLKKIGRIQSLMVLVSAEKVEVQEKEKEYAELRDALKPYFSAYNMTDPNNYVTLIEFYTYFRSKMLTYEERQNFVKNMYERIERDLESRQIRRVNIEINQDKKAVSEKISLFDLDKSYNELLAEIDSFVNTETSKIVNAGMISNLRTFMGNLLKDVASRIAKNNGEEIPMIKGRAEMGSIRSYLKKNLVLSDNDDKFIDSFVSILHSEGGHAFMSEKEYFRLARNIAIEIALFVLSKYEKKFKS